MQKRRILPIIIGLSLVFNILFVVEFQKTYDPPAWLFTDLGPGIMQDSYYIRAPGLESPFGLIGDVPGGYSLYVGNTLQNKGEVNALENLNESGWAYGISYLDTNSILLALCFAIIPLGIILILGRKSYGSSKTQ